MQHLACPKCGNGLSEPDERGLSRCLGCAALYDFGSAVVTRMAERAARIPMTNTAVLAHLRRHFAGVDDVYLCPHVPDEKERVARRAHVMHLPPNDLVLALYDDAIFGTGDDGFVVTARRLCWKNAGEAPSFVLWSDLDPERMYPDGRTLVLEGGAIVFSRDAAIVDVCLEAFSVLAISGRGATHESGLRPRSSDDGARFACWDCETPVEARAPRCPVCGARPTARGWLRTA